VLTNENLAEGLSRFPGATASPMNDARNIGEEFTCASSQSLISVFRCGLAYEFRNRFAPCGGGTLNLLVEVRI
jgi:hypothetical protein